MSEVKSIDAIIKTLEDLGANDIDSELEHLHELNFIYGHAVNIKHESEWISVDDRLPEISDFRPADESMAGKERRIVEVLVSTKSGKVAVTQFTALGWVNYFDVICWQPLPEPAKI